MMIPIQSERLDLHVALNLTFLLIPISSDRRDLHVALNFTIFR